MVLFFSLVDNYAKINVIQNKIRSELFFCHFWVFKYPYRGNLGITTALQF